jgi:lysophospholipase L1-like esterase
MHPASLALPAWAATALLAAAAPMKFDFGSGRVAPGSTGVDPSATYAPERGHGFEIGKTPVAVDRGGDPWRGDFLTADGPFCFSVDLPEGNYDITVTLGDPQGASDTTVRAECRRLMLEKVVTADGQTLTRRFTVDVHRPEIRGGGTVALKPSETGYLHWDRKLTLEFAGPRPCVAGIEITPAAPDTTTVFLLGDSTVTDQPFEPWNSWGQMLPRFFKPGTAVANFAESGESLQSSLGRRRVDKVCSMLRPGDHVLIQFGHNDMKDKRPGALQGYEASLTKLVERIRELGGHPVLVTSMERKPGITADTLAGYPDAVRRVAAKTGTPLIDLHATSKVLYRALGPRLDAAFVDGTHHNNFGSYQLARCVVEGIRHQVPALSVRLAEDARPFDPAKPDDPATFVMPVGPLRDPAKPDGN